LARPSDRIGSEVFSAAASRKEFATNKTLLSCLPGVAGFVFLAFLSIEVIQHHSDISGLFRQNGIGGVPSRMLKIDTETPDPLENLLLL
jgi:hypothetical protein